MNYFILGLGITGISTIKTLSSMKFNVYCYDENIKDFSEIESLLEGFNYNIVKNIDEFNFNMIDTVVKSPGIPLENSVLDSFKKKNIEIISDLELAYRLFPEKNLISITGTNGKTTTVMLLTYILNYSGKNALAVGNIGLGMLWEIYTNNNIDYFVIECSSFQLASISTFKSNVSGIINITEDHIDWHKTFEKYVQDKSKIFLNQTNDDFLIANIDDCEVMKQISNIKAKIFPVSLSKLSIDGIFYDTGTIYYKDNNIDIPILETKDLKIVGKHNIENTMVAIGMALKLNIGIENIKYACQSFNPVEHRIEFVREYKNVEFYNDSKGTNIDATNKAINSFNSPIILIAGGYDKKIDFDNLFNKKNNLKALVLFGETKDKMKFTAEKYGLSNVVLVNNMIEAIEKSVSIMNEGDIVLLSPANASWGMYSSYIERGKDFKEIVNRLGD